jgi:outer membrane protein OmpA-like peptidoglycan-associated protein
MRLYLATALLLCSLAAQAQAPLPEGRSADLVVRAPVGLVYATTDLKFSVADLGGKFQDVQVKQAALAGKTQDLQVKETATEIRIELAADVLFDFDKATIKPEAASALHNVATIIADKGQGRGVRIDGHTDSKGGDAYNQNLSERRAASVKLWLVDKEGLGKVKMTTQGFGARKPVAPNTKPDGSDDPEGRQKNRRVEIVLAK